MHNCKVTINGNWEGQKKHILSFENPCFTDEELEIARLISVEKKYNEKLNICFVGRIEADKGVLIILELMEKLKDVLQIGNFYIVGDGTKKNIIKEEIKKVDINVTITGWLPRQELNQIYTKCHLIILPSYASEGFPKVIAEAASFGCIPIVCNQSSIGQYIKNNISGILLNDLSSDELKELLLGLIENRRKLVSINKEVAKWIFLFTYSRYVNRIKSEIIFSTISSEI